MVLLEYDREAVLPKKWPWGGVEERENFNGRVDIVTCSEGIGWGQGLCGHMLNLRSEGLWLWWGRVCCDRFEYELSCRDRGDKRNVEVEGAYFNLKPPMVYISVLPNHEAAYILLKFGLLKYLI